MPVSTGLVKDEENKDSTINAPSRGYSSPTASPGVTLSVPSAIAAPPSIIGPTAATQSAQTAKVAAPGSKAVEPGSAAPSAQNGFGDQSSLMPQTAGQAGTGYVNLSRVLGANLGAGTNVLGAGNDKLQKEFAQRSASEKDYTTNRDKAVAGSALNSNAFEASSPLEAALASGSDDLKRGITGLNFGQFGNGTGSSDYMKDLAGLGNGQTTGRVLAKDAGITGQYAPKLSALDALIYGGNSAAAGSVAGVKEATGQEAKNAAASAKTLNSQTGQLNKYANDVAEQNKNTLRGAVSDYGTFAQGLADKTNKENANTGYQPVDGSVAPGVPQATAGNYTTAGMASRSKTIADLLGDPTLAMTSAGQYDGSVADQQREWAGAAARAQPTAPAPASAPQNPSDYDFRAIGVTPDGNGGYRSIPGAPVDEAKLDALIKRKKAYDQWVKDHPADGSDLRTTSRSY